MVYVNLVWKTAFYLRFGKAPRFSRAFLGKLHLEVFPFYYSTCVCVSIFIKFFMDSGQVCIALLLFISLVFVYIFFKHLRFGKIAIVFQRTRVFRAREWNSKSLNIYYNGIYSNRFYDSLLRCELFWHRCYKSVTGFVCVMQLPK